MKAIPNLHEGVVGQVSTYTDYMLELPGNTAKKKKKNKQAKKSLNVL